MRRALILCVILASFTSCGRKFDEWMNRFGGVVWSVSNRTEQTLKLKFPSFSDPGNGDYKTYVIEPNTVETIDNYKRSSGQWEGNYFMKCRDAYGEDVCWQILSEDDEVLRTWRFSDFGQPDQRFFDESAWFQHRQANGYSYITFRILPEDIE